MKTLFFSLLLSFLSLSDLPAQLAGNAFLSGQTNHSGIKVKFNAHPGTAVSDSMYTTSSGSYSVNITGGVYDVVFSKPGYLSAYYNSGAAVVLTNTVTMNSYTLQPGNQVFVSGPVAGYWANTNTYIVTGDIRIPAQDTLIIQPGTNIRFTGNFSVLDTGLLIASGTTTDPILFTSNYAGPAPGDWNQISVSNSASIIDHCIIEYAKYGVTCSSYSPVISNNIIRQIVYTGISCMYCAAHIFQNEVYNIINTNNYAAVGIWADGGATVECNHIYNCSSTQYHGYGMITGAKSTVRNNHIHNISGPSGNWGIWENADTSWIYNNYIHDANIGIEVGNTGQAQTPIITNNTIVNHNYAGITTFGYGTPYIANNIIANNAAYGILAGSSSSMPSAVTHNLVWNNTNSNYGNVQIVGIGQVVGTNSQGNPIDSYYNLSQDPLFAGGLPPILSGGSPCLGAGEAAYSANIGYDTAYTCLSGLNGISTMTDLELLVCPNPSTGLIKFISDNLVDEVQVTDLLGKVIYRSTPASKESVFSIEIRGVYFAIFRTSRGYATKKLVIQ